MLLTIPKVLDRGEAAAAVETIERARFVDGKRSAGTSAREVKHNEELDPGAPEIESLNKLVVGTLYRNAVFQAAVLPHRVSGAFFARYTPGMFYGEHVDDPVMGEGSRYRSDVSATVFLCDPDAYEGGELVIRTAFGTQAVKLPAGDAVVYPSSTLHRVAEVTGGRRIVAVAWAQSLVRDPMQRELLYDLHLARETLRKATPRAEVTKQVDNVYTNLVRMWAEV